MEKPTYEQLEREVEALKADRELWHKVHARSCEEPKLERLERQLAEQQLLCRGLEQAYGEIEKQMAEVVAALEATIATSLPTEWDGAS